MTDCIISGKHHTQKNLAAKEVLEIEGETVRTEHKFGERKNCLKIKQKNCQMAVVSGEWVLVTCSTSSATADHCLFALQSSFYSKHV